MSLNLIKALLILNTKKGWSEAARKKAAMARKSKKKTGTKKKTSAIEVMTKPPAKGNYTSFSAGEARYHVKTGDYLIGKAGWDRREAMAKHIEKKFKVKLDRDGIDGGVVSSFVSQPN